jgi:hypothetical protein
MTEPTQSAGPGVEELLERIARRPAPRDLWRLRGLLQAHAGEGPQVALVQDLNREFYLYLSEVQSKLNARHFNDLASRLDVGSVGLLALQDILVEQEDVWKSLLLGGLGEGMMVLASRQYVKAWERDLESVHRRAAWMLYDLLWRISLRYQPQMATGERQELIDASLLPALEEDTPFETRMLLLLRLFQVLLLLSTAPLYVTE